MNAMQVFEYGAIRQTPGLIVTFHDFTAQDAREDQQNPLINKFPFVTPRFLHITIIAIPYLHLNKHETSSYNQKRYTIPALPFHNLNLQTGTQIHTRIFHSFP